MKIETKPSPKYGALLAPVFALALANSAVAQQVSQPPPPPDTNTPSPDVLGEEDLIVLSPFQVDVTKDKGYFAENTLAGSRLRVNVSDLGAAISVVTKQQLEDTASLDVNDIFRYEIGTEGSSTYTPDVRNPSRNTGVFESIAGNAIGGSMAPTTNTTANRVRGLGSPTFAINYYNSLSMIPFDSYNAASFEINRGPNSLLFGMGSPAGIVNMSTAQATLNKDSAQVQLRVDDRGSDRVSINFNKVLIKDKLAIHAAALYNDEQFVRKPSYDLTRRQYGAITYKPFKGTTIRANIEGYSNDNRRPNSISPIDGVSEWRKAGRPVYDALTHEVKSLDSGDVVSMYASGAQSPWAADVRNYVMGRPDFDPALWDAANNRYNGVTIFGNTALSDVNSILFAPGLGQYNARVIARVADGQPTNYFQPLGGSRPRVGAWGNAAGAFPFSTTPTATDYIYNMDRTRTDAYDWAEMAMGNWSKTGALYDLNDPNTKNVIANTNYYPGVTDKSIYDWTEHNILAMNFGNMRNTSYNVELEQEIIPNLLHFTAGGFRQDFDSMSLYNLGSLDATTLLVDTNLYNSDGTPNPYVGRPYVRDEFPDRIENSSTVDQYRGMLAFTPDFTQNAGWTKWLGRHQIMGMASYMDSLNTTIRRRLVFAASDQQEGIYRYTADPSAAGWAIQGGATMRRHFYLASGGGQPGDGRVTQAAGRMDGDPVTGPVRVFDYATGEYKDINMTSVWNPFDNGTTRNARTLLSYATGWTGYLWKNRIVTTLGVRRDINKTRGVTPNAVGDLPSMTNAERFVNGAYQYDVVFDRWQDWTRMAGTTKTVGAVVKPFQQWESIYNRSGNSLFWEFVENFGFSANKSDNFDAPGSTQVDPFGKVLAKPEGSGQDYGIQFSLFKGKLYTRLNWFESDNKNVRYAGAMSRLIDHIDTTAFRGWLEHIYMINDGANPATDNWTDPYRSGTATFNQAKQTAMQEWVGDNWFQSVPGQFEAAGGRDAYNNYGMNRVGGITGTTTSSAKGVELTVNYNPLPNWTIKVTGTKVETSNTDTTKEIDAWLSVRRPLWDNARAVDYLTPAGLALLNSIGGVNNYLISDEPSVTRRGNIETFWQSTNFTTATKGTPINSDDATNRWTTVEAYRQSVFDSQLATQRDLEGQIAAGQREYNVNLLTNYNFERGVLKGWGVGGAQRYASKAIIGYYGKDTLVDVDDLYDASDTTRPIYDDAQWYTDLWVSYTRKIFADKVRMKLQLNVADAFEGGGLQPIAADWLGNPYGYRIVDSRKFILAATFDF